VRQFTALYRTLVGTIDTRARRFGFLALALVGVGVGAIVSGNHPVDQVRAAITLVDTFNLNFLVPVAALVYGTAAFGDPNDDGTLVYLWLRPVPRPTIVAAAALASSTFVVPVAVAPAMVEAAILRVDARVVVGAGVAAAVGAVAYTAFFLLLGLATNRSLVWGIGYVLIDESFIARGGRSLGALSIHSHAASILARTAERRIKLASFSAPTAVVACAVIAVVALVISSRRLQRAEVP
jgi:ABC-2 type transport system permease protein